MAQTALLRAGIPTAAEILAPTPGAAPGGRGGATAPVPVVTPSNEAGQKLLENACGGCHTLSRVTSKNLPQPDWQRTVDRMKLRGADVSDEDTIALVAYLVKTYGPK